MPQRVSLKEQYDNRDVIAQIYRLIALVESSTIVRTTSVQEGSTVTVTLDMYDGTSKTFTFNQNADMTTDTEQDVTALKNFLAGLNVTGNTQIDGDTQIVNGHSLQVAGDLDVAGDTEVAGKLTVHGQSEISGMAVEESSGATVLSNANGIKSASPVTLSGDVVVPTTVTGQRDTEAVNGTRLQNDLDNYAHMLRTTGDQTKMGTLTFDAGSKLNIKSEQLQNRLTITGPSFVQGDFSTGSYVNLLTFRDNDNKEIMTLRYGQNSSGLMSLDVLFNDGTQHSVNLASYTSVI